MTTDTDKLPETLLEQMHYTPRAATCSQCRYFTHDYRGIGESAPPQGDCKRNIITLRVNCAGVCASFEPPYIAESAPAPAPPAGQ